MPVTTTNATSPGQYNPPTWITVIAAVCAVWWIFILAVQLIGARQLFHYYSSIPKPSVSSSLSLSHIPHVTIIRPVKGLEYGLYDCLASTFQQDFPKEKLTIYLCISSAADPAYPVLQRILSDYPQFDAQIFVEEEDPLLSGHGGSDTNLGPNPKIRNMSRGYREARGDIVWIIDCNVWVTKEVAGRMVDKLCGYRPNGIMATPYKFVHQLPLVIDVGGQSGGLLMHEDESDNASRFQVAADHSTLESAEEAGGGRLEESFMAGSHAKFYTAINTVGVAPCIVGKSNMFRRSHLDHLTSTSSKYAAGIDYFSHNICEDHLIGDLLWKNKVPGQESGQHFKNHGLVFGDLAIQPIAKMSVKEYAARRVRWLRVRKWTVLVATLVEPGVESLLCSAYGSFALTTLPWPHEKFGIPHTWAAFFLLWLALVTTWCVADWVVYNRLHALRAVAQDVDTPAFARSPKRPRRSFGEWLAAWLGRELLALPIWITAWAGSKVTWRNKDFTVGYDTKVHELETSRFRVREESRRSLRPTPELENGKVRRD